MKVFTQKDTSVYIQFQLGKELFYLGECVDLDSIPNPRLGGIDLIQCRKRSGKGFKTLAKKYSPPGAIEVTITEMSTDVISWLEKVQCPFTLYALQRSCGDAGVPKNWIKGAIVYQSEITADNLNQLSHHLDENENQHEWSISGVPPRVDVRQVTSARLTTAEAEDILCLAICDNLFCDDDCGAYTLPCYNAYFGCDTAVAPATANVQYTEDNGTTIAATAADPFTGAEAGCLVAAMECFEISAGINRIFAVRGTLAATPLGGAYSDDGGATWTSVVIGAVNAEAVVGPKALHVIDQYHMWVGTDSGNIYFSEDGGLTWALQGTSTGAASINAINFADEDTGMVVCDTDVIMLTIDGGVHWTAGTATGTGDDLLSCACFNANRMIVGTDSVAGDSLWMTWDGTATWAGLTFTGMATEQVTDMDFYTDGVGVIVTNTAAPIGSLHQTIDGGANWKEIQVPTNAGFKAVKMCGANEGYFVGQVVGAATGFIGHFG